MSEETNQPEETNLVSIEEFMKLDLRVGKILSCEKVPKSKKLLVMQVDLGGEQRQLLAGLSQVYLPEEMIGRRVVVVANLKPAKLMGLESQGMMLAAAPEDGSGIPALVSVPEGLAPAQRYVDGTRPLRSLLSAGRAPLVPCQRQSGYRFTPRIRADRNLV